MRHDIKDQVALNVDKPVYRVIDDFLFIQQDDNSNTSAGKNTRINLLTFHPLYNNRVEIKLPLQQSNQGGITMLLFRKLSKK